MPDIYFKETKDLVRKVTLSQGQTVLSGLIDSGIDVPYGCLSGVCQSCVLMSSESEIPEACQHGLTNAQKGLGYFLSCCCRPTESMAVSISKLFNRKTSQVLQKKRLSEQVMLIRINKVLNYKAGQYLTLCKDADLARTYSIASHPDHDDFIELHIRLHKDGLFSPWAFNTLAVGDEIEVIGPMGECFYSTVNQTQPILLCGIGTGLAPLYGIVRDALLSGHTGRILLIIGAKTAEGIYYKKELRQLQSEFPQLEIKSSIAASNTQTSDIYAYTKELAPDLTDTKVYLCGEQNFVKKMRKQAFLAGASMNDISSDIFLMFSQEVKPDSSTNQCETKD